MDSEAPAKAGRQHQWIDIGFLHIDFSVFLVVMQTDGNFGVEQVIDVSRGGQFGFIQGKTFPGKIGFPPELKTRQSILLLIFLIAMDLIV